jgi:hypothetical protein
MEDRVRFLKFVAKFGKEKGLKEEDFLNTSIPGIKQDFSTLKDLI